MAEGEISISGALSFAWSLLSHNWRAIWGVLALNALSWTVLFAGLFSDRTELIGMGLGATLTTIFPLCGAIYRLGVVRGGREEANLKPGALGIQWGGIELRSFLAVLLLLVFLAILFVLMLIAVSLPLVGIVVSKGVSLDQVKTPEQLQHVLGDQVTQVAAVAQLGILVILGFIAARLTLAPVASGLGGRLAVLRTWKLTRGAGWRLFVTFFLVLSPIWLTVMLAGAGLHGALTSFSPAQILGYSVLSGILAGAASMPLAAGLQLYFYKALEPAPPSGGAGGTERR